MTASTFINAIVRFHARRPGLRTLFSDNGTNIKGGANALMGALQSWNEQMASELLLRGVEWKSSPPHAPHWGGVWERLIRDAKKHLTMLLGNEVVDVETFGTVLVEAERIMNNRPLTYASSDASDMTVLTPSDFLYPGIIATSSTNILPPAPPGAESLRYQWQKARSLVDSFWERWTREYLHTLQQRSKWHKTKPD